MTKYLVMYNRTLKEIFSISIFASPLYAPLDIELQYMVGTYDFLKDKLETLGVDTTKLDIFHGQQESGEAQLRIHDFLHGMMYSDPKKIPFDTLGLIKKVQSFNGRKLSTEYRDDAERLVVKKTFTDVIKEEKDKDDNVVAKYLMGIQLRFDYYNTDDVVGDSKSSDLVPMTSIESAEYLQKRRKRVISETYIDAERTDPLAKVLVDGLFKFYSNDLTIYIDRGIVSDGLVQKIENDTQHPFLGAPAGNGKLNQYGQPESNRDALVRKLKSAGELSPNLEIE